MGRPSLADERRRQIIDALIESVREKGYEATTLDEIARRAGVRRSIIRHYVGNREDLLVTAVEQISERYRRDYLTLVKQVPARRRLPVLLAYLFGGGFNQRPDEDAVVDALVGVARQHEVVGQSLRQVYEVFENTVFDAIIAAHPEAPEATARAAAYAVMCLAEQNASLLALGVDPRRTADARLAADTLIRTLAR